MRTTKLNDEIPDNLITQASTWLNLPNKHMLIDAQQSFTYCNFKGTLASHYGRVKDHSEIYLEINVNWDTNGRNDLSLLIVL